MERKKEPDEDVVRFMRVVMEAMDAPSATALTEKLVDAKAIERAEWRKVPKWVAGTNAPEHKATVRLLAAAGLLRDFAQVTPVVRRDRPEELSEGVELILDETAKGFEKLSRRLDRLEKRLPPEAEQDDQRAMDEA